MHAQNGINEIEEATKLIAKGHVKDAVIILKVAVSDNANSYKAWSLLSKCLFEEGDLIEAVQASQHASSVDPLQQSFDRIQIFIQKQAFAEASEIANAMLSQYQHHPKAIITLAHIATKRNDPESSAMLLERGIQDAPANLTLRNMLTNSYASAGYFAKALKSASLLVDLDEGFESLWSLIGLLFKYGQYEDLLLACNRASAYVEQNALKISQLELVRGQALRIIGKRQESIQALQASIASNAQNADAWWALADMKDYVFSEDERCQIKGLIETPDINPKQRCVAAFAYAKASESQDSASNIMLNYKAANDLGLSQHYHPNILEAEFAARMNTYTPQNLASQADCEYDTPRPIFILGLPRSGSTLIEQILASHEHIIGTLEQPTLPIIESRAQTLCMQRYNLPLAKALGMLTPTELSQLGKAYLDESAIFRSENTRFFIDKQPFNFRLIGFIHKILPQAFIIDVRRNPMDCGLSLYKQYFHSGVDFSYKLAHIAQVYKAYIELMRHWDRALPGRVFKLQYEDLVEAPEQHIHALLDAIELPFSEQCLNFYQTNRSIHTASSEQVRQPLSKKGIGAWRKFDTQLLELINSLKAAGVYSDERC